MNTGPESHDTPQPADSDTQLLERFRRGEGQAATLLFRRYAERLRAMAKARLAPDLAVRLDADDIVQSVFRSFFRRAADGQYQVAPGEELWKLLLVITLNKVRAAGEFNRARKRDLAATHGHQELSQAGSTADRQYEQTFRELQMLVNEIVARLPLAQQRMVQMRLEGYEFSEIAAATNRSKRSVERVLQDFRRELQASLHQDASEQGA